MITAEQVEGFAVISGDHNPLHMNDAFARAAGFRGRVVHGMVTASLVSFLIGMRMPGPGALWLNQELRWLAPVFIGDKIDVELKVMKISPGTRTVKLHVMACNQDGKKVMDGSGLVKVLEVRHGHGQY